MAILNSYVKLPQRVIPSILGACFHLLPILTILLYPRLGKRHLGLWWQITQAENHIRAGQQPPVSSNMVCDRKSSFVYDFPMKFSIS